MFFLLACEASDLEYPGMILSPIFNIKISTEEDLLEIMSWIIGKAMMTKVMCF